MSITFGPSATSFSGRADDGDSTTAPGTYLAATPGGCSDAATSVYAHGTAMGAPDFLLSGRTLGQTAKSDHGAYARALADVVQVFTIKHRVLRGIPLLSALIARLFPKVTLVVETTVTVKVDFRDGIGDVTFTAGVAGGPAAVNIADMTGYHFEVTGATPPQIDVTRYAFLVSTISNPGIFVDQLSSTFSIDPGRYQLDLTLNVEENFDGHAELMGITNSHAS